MLRMRANDGTRYPDDLGCRNRRRDDAQRALHEHHEVWIPFGRGRVRRHHLDARPTDRALAPYLDREERSDGPPSRKARLRDMADRDARQATQRRRPTNVCVDRFHVRIRRTNSLCDFVGGISWYSGIAGRIKSFRRLLTRRHSQRATAKSGGVTFRPID
jgi:hypothetical protein